MHKVLSLGLLCAVVSLPAYAQPNAGSLLNQQRQQQHHIFRQLPAPAVKRARPPLKKGGPAVVVHSIRFSGATDLVPEAALQHVVSYAIGKKLDFAGLETLARKVTDYLHAQGWFLANAYLPQQDVTKGNIDIAIRAGRLDGANGKGTPFGIVKSSTGRLRISRARLDAIAAPLLRPGAAAKKDKLERALLLMDRLPGISAQARLQRGQNPDSTHVAIAVNEGPLASASAWIDNYGNYSTGTIQENILAQLNDPAHIGDQLSALATHSRGLDMGRLGYSVPLASNGLRLGLSTTMLHYRVVQGLGQSAGLSGRSSTYAARLSYPLILTRRLHVDLSAGYEHEHLKDSAATGMLDDKRVGIWNAGVSGSELDRLGGGGLTAWGLTLNAGNLDLSADQADAEQDASGYRTAGQYVTLDYNVSRLQKLPGAFTLYATLTGQQANKNLDSSAQFILGGPYGIRAYPVGEASGDEGWLGHVSLRYSLPHATPLGHWQFVTFYDLGHITLHDNPRDIPIDTATGENSYGLADWGVGVNLQRTARYSVQLTWAQTLGSNPGRSVQGYDVDNHAYGSRVWLQALVWF